MTYFEVEGVRRQEEAHNPGQAVRQFEHSCELCALRGIHLRCESCKIQEAHANAMRNFRIEREVAQEQNKCRQAYSPRFGIITQVMISL